MQAILHKITPLNQYSSNYVSLVYHRIYQKYRLAKACPEPDLRYFAKAILFYID